MNPTIEITNYTASASPQLVNIDKTQYMAIDGIGDPMKGISNYHGKAETIYFLFSLLEKQEGFSNIEIPALDTLWFVDEGVKFEDMNKDEWKWKMLLPIPFEVTATIFEKVKELALSIQPNNLFINDFELSVLEENEAIHILHIGLYEKICDSLAKIEVFMEENNFIQVGPHHDIYLNNPQMTPADELETIIRIPIKKQ